ncbi:MAG: hypothetical protein ABW219_07170 [Ilumatobacteraceae bacterium]
MQSGRTGEFAVALSGGGHRATLFAIGALMALVDRGLNRQVVQISSVSGGSIANAFVAQRCRFDQLDPGELDPIAAELIGTIAERGVLSRLSIAVVTGGSILIGLAVAVVLWQLSVPSVFAVLVGLFLVAGILLTSGLIVQHLLDQRYFSPGRTSGKLGDLADRTVEHVFCSTDLVLGEPVHFSTWDGGTAWRMTGTGQAGRGPTSAGVRYEAKGLSLAEVVRASSAFPGIPPLRLRSDSALGAPRRSPARRRTGAPGAAEDLDVPVVRSGVLFLADGGLWNNLGSHVLREHHILRGREANDVGLPLLCVNSSAPGAASARFVYSVPVLAQVAALFRTLRVLTVNTVRPRVTAIADAMTRRNALGLRPGPRDPLDVVVDLTDVPRHEDTVRRVCVDRDDVRRSDPVHDRYRQDLVASLAAWADQLQGAPSPSDSTQLSGFVLAALRGRPKGSDEGTGVLDRRTLEEVLVQPWWAAVRANAGGDDLAVPTTLSRVDRTSAAQLVLRGYANTWLSSLLLDSHDAGAPPDDIVARVRAMAGLPAAPPPPVPATPAPLWP